MRISYLTVCVNYLDFLRVSYHHNAGQFDDYTIVTSPNDAHTISWCQANKLGLVVTDAFYRNGAVFNKGLALNEGLNVMQQGDKPLEWVVIMDADTFVPPDFRARLAEVKLDKEWFYGCERILVPTWKDYEGLWTRDIETYKSPLGWGFGYFQLFHWESEAIKACKMGEWYPTGNDCTEVDWRHFRKWGNLINDYAAAEGRMAKLPFKVVNLGPDGVNHQARCSPPFIAPQ